LTRNLSGSGPGVLVVLIGFLVIIFTGAAAVGEAAADSLMRW